MIINHGIYSVASSTNLNFVLLRIVDESDQLDSFPCSWPQADVWFTLLNWFDYGIF
jgi:hypothetical protein